MRPASWLSPDPKVEPSRALLTWGPTSHPLVYGLSGTQMPCLSVARGGDPGSVCIQLELTSTDGTRIAGPWLLPDGTFWVEPQVWFTDLNRDGRLDVVVLIQSDGAGLAGSEGRLIVIRSQTAGGWRADYRDAYLNSPVNFMVDPDSTSCVVMTTNIAQRKGEDGIEHSFWVHSAHVIVDQGYAPIVTGIWRDFPKCIQYTQKPNHEPTRLLSAKHLAELTSNAAATGWRLVPNLKSH
ncbi:hypothetical protein LBMAG53_38250 [Planctomycetota bacterium]|nr:hypothetical protein LBMAG53_38250 [Planctomycetota bacterium]